MAQTKDVVIGQLGKSLCHYVSLVNDLETQLSIANSRNNRLQFELEEQQKRYADATSCIRKLYSKWENADRELKGYRASAGNTEDNKGKQDRCLATAKTEITRLEAENRALQTHIEQSMGISDKTQELCKRVEDLEKENSALRQKISNQVLENIATSRRDQLDQASLSHLQHLMAMLEANCCELKCRLGYTTEKTGVQESGQHQGNQVVPTFCPTSQVVCEEADQGNSVEDFWRSRDVDQNDGFFYRPQPPLMSCPGSPWANIKSQIRRADSKQSLKKVDNPYVKRPLKFSNSFPV